MKNLKIAQKLIVSFLIVIALSVVVGVVGIIGVTSLNSSLDSLYLQQTVPIVDMANVVEAFQRIRVNVREFEVGALTNDVEAVEEARGKILTYQADITAALDAFDPTIITAEVQSTFDEARAAYDTKYKPFLEDLYKMALENAQDETNAGVPAMVDAIDVNAATSRQIADGFGKGMDL